MKYTEMGLADLQILIDRLLDSRNDLEYGDPERVPLEKKIIAIDDRMNYLVAHAFEE